MTTIDPYDYIHRLRFEDIPAAVVHQAKRCLLDLIGVAAAGRSTPLSRIAHDFAVSEFASPGAGARLLFDGRRVSPSGAAFAGAATIDSFDAHDGHRLTKGHAGVALLPALLALADTAGAMDGRQFLTALVLGYEIATRAGMALHATACDYHTSGAWNALGVAAIGARIHHLDRNTTREALGIAEYHGPRSQMMRCIDHPTMVKDGSGWGALAGMSAVGLARTGFTGAPALLIEGERERAFWQDLGTRWCILEQYFKPQPVCRWAQPAIEATAALKAGHSFEARDIASVKIETFAEAVRLGTALPETTEQAQYALGFPVAALLARGAIGSAEISDRGLADPAIAEMLRRLRATEDTALSALFPAERLARVSIRLTNGDVLTSPITSARGDPDAPLSDDEIIAKFRHLSGQFADRQENLIDAVMKLDTDQPAFAKMAADVARGT